MYVPSAAMPSLPAYEHPPDCATSDSSCCHGATVNRSAVTVGRTEVPADQETGAPTEVRNGEVPHATAPVAFRAVAPESFAKRNVMRTGLPSVRT